MSRSLKTGDLVLCKVGSFPPWPAVVYPQSLLRSDVYRKKKPNCIAVCFFNDPTYYWEQPNRLSRLDPHTIDEYLTRNNGHSSQSDLNEAYQRASDYTGLQDFIVERFKEEGREEDLEQAIGFAEIKSGEDPTLGKSKKDPGKRKVSGARADSESSSMSSSNKNFVSNGSLNSKKINPENLETDLSDDRVKLGKGNSKRTHKRNHASQKSIEKTNEKRTKLDRSRRVEISLLFRRRIQKNLVQRDEPPVDAEIEESHNMLNKIKQNLGNEPPFFDSEALRESKLHKLFKVIVNDSNLEQFHPVCKSALIQWKDIITELKSERLKDEQQDA
ncbi:hypothetical protein HG535_0C06070 [Zygotorulaspora mrakii]|uniref:PWWP domain-containing protein n=1 Tax=Zygotorulaspora mrakii TaxID=42260 RepID=A0A7H9B3C2_ZYGMR|nr:uncharacterized protein HG535_0C06070 [Zygotorulaspora mrakii]QLG72252.1 hypothetical protein HG535_0C06070 [Zygotorulaspora mrakii]